MTKAGGLSINVEIERRTRAGVDRGTAGSIPQSESGAAEGLVTATHAILFEDASALACDACGARLPDRRESQGHEIPGQGAYVWVRGDSVQLDAAPLCAACASAIGVAALARWEIEEEES